MPRQPMVLLSLVLSGCAPAVPPATSATLPPASVEPASAESDATVSSVALPQPDARVGMQLVEVAPGIHAALQLPARRFADSNAVILSSEAGVVFVDGPQRVVAMRWLETVVDALAAGPRRVLITTHWHLDHSLGGTLWRQGLMRRGVQVEHWGHAGLDALLAERGAVQLDEARATQPESRQRALAMKEAGAREDGTRLTPQQREELDQYIALSQLQIDAMAEVSLATPTHHADTMTEVTLGSLTLELHPVMAHTDADLVVFVPQAGVLITGDVLDEMPFAGHGHPRRWLAALERLAKLGATTIIPGHGPVMGAEQLPLMIELWSELLTQAELAVQRGETPAARYADWSTTPPFAALRERLVTDEASARNFDRFIPGALARAVADLRGEL